MTKSTSSDVGVGNWGSQQFYTILGFKSSDFANERRIFSLIITILMQNLE